jgi:HPt (histidine-containing phosphotransfer) domain-containing protein
MTGAGDASIEALLAVARHQFVAGLPSRLETLEDLVGRGEWLEARRSAHKLRGAAATYGFVALGQSAASIEQILLDAQDRPEAEARERIARLLSESRAEAARAAEAP